MMVVEAVTLPVLPPALASIAITTLAPEPSKAMLALPLDVPKLALDGTLAPPV
ncbi:hypothetical protein D3C80_2154940 [compost metagenome]